MKYLTLIRSITLLHQYQRTLKTADYQGETIQYIERIALIAFALVHLKRDKCAETLHAAYEAEKSINCKKAM